MKRHMKVDNNTEEWWNEYYSDWRGKTETHPMPDITNLLSMLTEGKDKVLDLGCGMGKYYPYIRSREYVGIDLSPKALAYAEEHADGGTWICQDIIKHPIGAQEEYDLVCCGEMLEHVEDPLGIITQVHTALKPNGIAVFHCPYENMIPAPAHLWFISEKDIRDWCKIFSTYTLARWHQNWSNFLIVGRK